MATLVKEARKTLPDALGEVREAVDFCRYYAQQARTGLQPVDLPGPTGERNVLRYAGRGVWVCIAPWNFPLLLTIKPVIAALAAGNRVVVKPPEHTPETSKVMAEWLRSALPEDWVQVVLGGPADAAALTGMPFDHIFFTIFIFFINKFINIFGVNLNIKHIYISKYLKK